MRRLSLIVVGGLLGLACGSSPSVAPRAHLKPYCDLPTGLAPPQLEWAGPLPGDTPAQSPPGLYRDFTQPNPLNDLRVDWGRTPSVLVTASGAIEVDGQTVPLDALPKAITNAQEARESEFRSMGVYTLDVLSVVADARAPSAAVAGVLAAAGRANLRFARLLVSSAQPHTLLTAPDPARADAMRKTLLTTFPDQRGMISAVAVEDALRFCPGKQKLLDAWAMAAPEHKCELLAVGLEEVLPYCPLTDADAVISIAQVIYEPITPNQPAHFVVGLQGDPPAPGEAVTWGAWAPALFATRWMAPL